MNDEWRRVSWGAGVPGQHHCTHGHSLFQFSPRFLALALALFAVLVVIALYVHDGFIRPFLGDVLVVVWMFAVVRTWLVIDSGKLVIALVCFAWLVELGQYLQLVETLGLERYRLARIVLGSTFDWMDLLAYTLGGALIVVMSLVATRGKKTGVSGPEEKVTRGG